MAEPVGSPRHLIEAVATVGQGRVAVEVPADVVDADQVWELPGVARLDLAASLAELRLDVGQTEQLVDPGLLGEAMDLRALDLRDPVLADRVPALQGPLTQLDVVLGRPCEVLEQVPEGLLGPDPEVHLEPRVGENAGGDVAAAPGLGGEPVRGEGLDQAG